MHHALAPDRPLPPTPAGSAPATTWTRRLCQRLGRWCEFLLDTHQARVPF